MFPYDFFTRREDDFEIVIDVESSGSGIVGFPYSSRGIHPFEFLGNAPIAGGSPEVIKIPFQQVILAKIMI